MPEVRGQHGQRYVWLADALGGDGAVLTASRRLARTLRAVCNERHIAAGAMAWTTPQIWFWQDWVRDLLTMSAAADAPRPISASASIVLWEHCLRRHLESDILGLNSLTRQASAAWQRILEWCVPLATVASHAGSHDERIFVRAAQDYERLLSDRNWIDPAQLPVAAIARLREAACAVPGRIRLAGFDRVTPLVADLLDALAVRGCAVSAPPDNPCSGALSRQPFDDVEAEFRAAGAWAREILHGDPGANVAFVSAELGTNAARYARLIREGLAPGWQSGNDEYQNAVNVSFGRRLADYPAISIALLCLRWVTRGLPSRDVSLLLRTPFIEGDNPGVRARHEHMLRKLPDRRWTAAALAAALEDIGGEGAPAQWLDCVRRIAALQTRAVMRQAPSVWAEQFHELLRSVGWPGSGTLRSDEFQLINRWRELLNELAAMDAVLPELSIAEAIMRLTSLARDAVYQPELGTGVVSLLGALEAAGMEFDYLWVAGMDASRWPAPGHPLSLVSRRLQREHNMPDATPGDTLDYSRRVVGRLAASANHVRFSWARTDEDTRQMPSPILASLPIANEYATTEPGWYAGTLIGHAGVHVEVDDPVPAVDGVEQLAGGARLIELHWSEPFAAFAFGRLGVRNLERFLSGLSPILRGNILHETLYELYRDTPSKDCIAGWPDFDRRQRIDHAIDRALAATQRHADSVLRRLLALERSRLRLVINDFLHEEVSRTWFKVDRVEEKIEFEHAGVRLSLRADRIDRLSDDSVLIIDYKTGRPKHLLGKDGDPIEPQVVVYAAATEQSIGGLALVNISRRAIQYKGVGASVEWGAVTKEDWHVSLARWQAQVLTAIEEIAAGDVRINLHVASGQRRQLDVLSRIEEERRAR